MIANADTSTNELKEVTLNAPKRLTVDELRARLTDLTRDEFVVYCGLSRGTYYRWITGQTPAKLTLKQLKKMAKLLGVERIEDLPDDFVLK
jgi:transcriptional regulator with XRE-family HTH domain